MTLFTTPNAGYRAEGICYPSKIYGAAERNIYSMEQSPSAAKFEPLSYLGWSLRKLLYAPESPHSLHNLI